MDDVWTIEELVTLRSSLYLRRDLRDVAATLGRAFSEVEEMAHEMGWITIPPVAPDETKCGD
jgi:hypothetical protein